MTVRQQQQDNSPLLSDFDLHLLAEGKHQKAYEKLGSHLRQYNGVKGASFVVWAPNATRVAVVGDFNGWDGNEHPLENLAGSGIWGLFIGGLKAGKYFFSFRSIHGGLALMAGRCNIQK